MIMDVIQRRPTGRNEGKKRLVPLPSSCQEGRTIHPYGVLPMSKWIALAVVTAIAVAGALIFNSYLSARQAADAVPPTNCLDVKMKNIDGQEIDLKSYGGKVILIVNVASKCGLTPQYETLEALYEKYKDRGLVILGFPCNQFLGQEPGSAEDIKKFCATKYHVTFELFDKVDVNGEKACDLYKQLTAMDLQPAGPGAISWNFEKFLVNREGVPVRRFSPRTKPDADDVVKAIEDELAAVSPASTAGK